MLSGSGKNVEGTPPPRHKHSAVIYDDCMWIYGGMTDLHERSDLWRWDIRSRAWAPFKVKPKNTPGPLHSHAACRLPSSMLIFGGERDGHPTNDVWRFSFGETTVVFESYKNLLTTKIVVNMMMIYNFHSKHFSSSLLVYE